MFLVSRLVEFLPFFFPLYLFRFDILGIPTNLTEIIIWLVGCIFIIEIIATQRFNFFNIWKNNSKIFWPALFFLLAISLTIFITVPKELIFFDGIDERTIATFRIALGQWKGFVFTPLIFLFLLRQAPLQNRIRAFNNFLITAALLSIFSWGLVFFGKGFTADLRLAGPFESANYLTLFLAPALAGIIPQILNDRKKKLNWLIGGIILAGIIGTRSYAAWLAVGSTIFIFFLWQLHFNWNWRKIIITFFILAGIFTTQIGSEKFTNFLNFSQRSSTTVRLEVWQIAFNLIRENFIFGIGPGQFETQYLQNAHAILGRIPIEWVMLHPHNFFLTTWLSAGILGLSAMLWLIINFFRLVKEKVKQQSSKLINSEKVIIISATLAFLTILLHGLVDTPFWKNDLALIWWLIIGMV